MNRSEIDMSDKPEGKDDLQAIKGIGKSIAKALNELGIQGYMDLASYDADHLREMLKERLPSIAMQRATPESWIQQARLLVESETKEARSVPPQSDEMAWNPGTTRGTNARSGWKEIADFFLSFGYEEDENGETHLMTRVHHSQADQQMQWQGIDTKELLQWLGEQARLPQLAAQGAAPEREEEQNDAVEDEPETIRVSISNLWVSEVGIPAMGAQRAESSRLRVSSNLTLSGQGSEGYIQERLQFAIDILLVNTETNQPLLVGTYNSRLKPGELSYPMQQDFLIPKPGRYQLYLMARVPPTAEAVKFVQGPIIVVEE